jgi:hypothetical protein
VVIGWSGYALELLREYFQRVNRSALRALEKDIIAASWMAVLDKNGGKAKNIDFVHKVDCVEWLRR